MPGGAPFTCVARGRGPFLSQHFFRCAAVVLGFDLVRRAECTFARWCIVRRTAQGTLGRRRLARACWTLDSDATAARAVGRGPVLLMRHAQAAAGSGATRHDPRRSIGADRGDAGPAGRSRYRSIATLKRESPEARARVMAPLMLEHRKTVGGAARPA